jgi:DNA-directed RNA polymerase specialized sigma subunit
MRIDGSIDYKDMRDMMEAAATLYGATEDRDDYEYQLAVRALPRLVDTSLLTDNQRDMLYMRYDKGMSQKAIAAALGVAPATVSKSLKVARRRIGIIYAAIFPRFKMAKNFGEDCELTKARLSPGAL